MNQLSIAHALQLHTWYDKGLLSGSEFKEKMTAWIEARHLAWWEGVAKLSGEVAKLDTEIDEIMSSFDDDQSEQAGLLLEERI